MASEELLFVFIMKILNNEQASNVVDQGVFLNWVELNRVWVVRVVPN